LSRVVVGILNWNQQEDTRRCLASLAKVTYPELEIVVVDNGSMDDSVQAIRKHYPYVKILENSINRGCAGGRNDLLEYFLKTDAPYLMFLDNDAIVEPDCFVHLVEEIDPMCFGAVEGPKSIHGSVRLSAMAKEKKIMASTMKLKRSMQWLADLLFCGVQQLKKCHVWMNAILFILKIRIGVFGLKNQDCF
jgi:GT2 family glycosyltransferase